MGLFSKRSKSRSGGSSLVETSNTSKSSVTRDSADVDCVSNPDNSTGSHGSSASEKQGRSTSKKSAAEWVDQATTAADIGSQVVQPSTSSALSFGTVSAAGQDHSLVLYGANALAATAGEFTIKQAAQEVAVATVSAALVAGGVSTVVAPVVAVVIVVGHVLIRGATRYVYKKVRVRADQRSHVEQLHLNQAEPPDHFTMIINGNWVEGQFNAFLSPNDNDSYALIDPQHLRGLSKLIGGSKSCTVRDMSGFTTGVKKPFSVRLSMPDVLSLIRQSWEYEKFAETNDGTMTVMFIRAKKRSSTKLRIAWQNSGPLDSCQAMIFTEKEWKSSKFSKKTKPMPDGFADVDVALERSLVFV